MKREIGRLVGRRLARSLAKLLAAGLVMDAVARGGLLLTGVGSGTLQRAGVLTLAGGAALAAYLGTTLLLRAEEIHSAGALLRSRTAKTK